MLINNTFLFALESVRLQAKKQPSLLNDFNCNHLFHTLAAVCLTYLRSLKTLEGLTPGIRLAAAI